MWRPVSIQRRGLASNEIWLCEYSCTTAGCSRIPGDVYQASHTSRRGMCLFKPNAAMRWNTAPAVSEQCAVITCVSTLHCYWRSPRPDSNISSWQTLWRHCSIQRPPTSETALPSFEVPRLGPVVILVRETCRWRWVWSIGGMVLTGEKGVMGKRNLSQCHFVHQKYLMDWPRIETGPPRWQDGEERLTEPWHGLLKAKLN